MSLWEEIFLKINQLDGNLAQWWSSRVKILCFVEEGRGLNSEHKCPSKNQSLEEEKGKVEREDFCVSSLKNALTKKRESLGTMNQHFFYHRPNYILQDLILHFALVVFVLKMD